MRRFFAALVLLATGCTSREEAPRFPSGPVQPAADVELRRIDDAIRRFSLDRAGRLPATLDELSTENTPDGEPYLRRVGRDPWGRAYSYAPLRTRDGRYDLRSYGPDTLPGTGDDVVAPRSPGE